MVDISAVVLVWRDVEFLSRCLESLIQARGDLGLELVLIWNGLSKTDLETADQVLERFTGVPYKVFINGVNRGVGPARNQGLAAAHGRYVMLLDVDTVVTQGALQALVRFMTEHPKVGLAGPRLTDPQGNLQYTCRKLPTVTSKLLRRIPASWAQEMLGDEMLVSYDHRTPRRVDYVIGACQLIRRQAFEQVGYLDGQIFYGPEDVDYCIRMWRKGWQVMYVPDAVVVHNEQRLTQQNTFSKLSVIHALGLARYFMKYRYAFRRPTLY